jgi:chloramphenicol O-acetyltransferase
LIRVSSECLEKCDDVPEFIDIIKELYSIKTKYNNKTFSEMDPYGEENWNDFDENLVKEVELIAEKANEILKKL